MGKQRLCSVALICLSMLVCLDVRGGPGRREPYIRDNGLIFLFNRKSKRFELYDSELGSIFKDGILLLRDNATVLSSTSEAVIEVRKALNYSSLRFTFEGDRYVDCRLENNQLIMDVSGRADEIELRADTELKTMAGPAFLNIQQQNDQKVLITRFGPAAVPGAASLFDARRDMAISADEPNQVLWFFEKSWRLKARGPTSSQAIKISIIRNYYRDELGVTYYRAFEKRSFWKTAPVVAMTWYGICGSKQPQDLEILKPEINWVARELLPYAGQLVFQLDDNYHYQDDCEMRAFSDYIRSRGLIPGIWFTPYGIAPQQVYEKNPESFLKDEQGDLLVAFAGRNWGWRDKYGNRAGVINVENNYAVEQWFAMYWKKVSETWNYDFFKIDGMGGVVGTYGRAANANGIESFRKGLKIARRIVGPDKFINGCNQTPIQGAGIWNGSRTGGDTGRRGHAINVIIGYNYLNNFVLWCDPDAAAEQYNKPVEVVRLNSQARVLTGQQFLTDDYWTKVPPANTYVWQRSFPNLDIYPCNLYAISKEFQQYDLFDLRISKLWGTYDVVGLFNFDNKAATKTLDLSRLPLQAERVHVYEYWSSKYLGVYDRNAQITWHLKPLEGLLFAVVPTAKDNRPVLISTSRHVTQGGLDLASVQYQRDGNKWVVAGESSYLVSGDPYEIVFAAGRYRLTRATAADCEVTIANNNGAARLKFSPPHSGCARWEAVFEPTRLGDAIPDSM